MAHVSSPVPARLSHTEPGHQAGAGHTTPGRPDPPATGGGARLSGGNCGSFSDVSNKLRRSQNKENC